MRKNLYLAPGVLSAMLALSGCIDSGVYVGGGEALPGADNVLPALAPAGGTAGIEDYLQPATGTWRVNLDGQVQAIDLGSAALANAMVYDTDFDEWIINVDNRNFVLTHDGAGGYDNLVTCTTECAEFLPFDNDPATSQYGTFGYVSYENSTKLVEYFVHMGLKTAPASMPVSGSATYAGVFNGLVNYTDGSAAAYDYISGSADITANFSDVGGNIGFASTGVGGKAGSTYSLAGAAIISGNTYQGTVTGQYDDGVSTQKPSLVLDTTGAGSSLSGAFYGPNAEETAGVVYATSASGDPYWGEIAGGFWAQ